jgi:hypothetical protein
MLDMLGTLKMHQENPQMTPVPSSGATGQAQISADKKREVETYAKRLVFNL